ncbi:MAG: hypothetical protein JWQ75_3174 [Pseudarthrobacter sp.]|nr:hypothetical protein [Pseudarthrobacter sp.]
MASASAPGEVSGLVLAQRTPHACVGRPAVSTAMVLAGTDGEECRWVYPSSSERKVIGNTSMVIDHFRVNRVAESVFQTGRPPHLPGRSLTSCGFFPNARSRPAPFWATLSHSARGVPAAIFPRRGCRRTSINDEWKWIGPLGSQGESVAQKSEGSERASGEMCRGSHIQSLSRLLEGMVLAELWAQGWSGGSATTGWSRISVAV